MIKIATLLCVPALLIALIAATAGSIDPREAARLNNIGVAYMNQQLFEKGLKAFEEAAAKDPKLKVTTLNRGVALLNLQRVDEAKVLLQKAAQDDPKDPHAWYSLGLYYKNSDKPQAAIDTFRRVTEIDPNDADAWYFLGSTYSQLKQFPEAIEAFDRALKVDPLHASAQFGLSRAYQQSGQAEKAREGLKKFQYITQNKLGSPISLAYGEQGKYSRAEESPVAVEKVGAAIPVRFVDVTQSAGLPARRSKGEESSFSGNGACFVDYDGDGLIDVFLTDTGHGDDLSLYHNLGNGKFEDVTKKTGLDPTLHATSCTVGDYDNDGAVDIVVGLASGRILLLHNEKNGTYTDATASAGIETKPLFDGPATPERGVTFVDYDHDGDLDLYVTSRSLSNTPPGSWSEKVPTEGNLMWRNNGNGTFTNVTGVLQVGLSSGNASIGTDYNNDRAVDLVVTGTPKGPLIYENPREGAFPVRQPWSDVMPEDARGVAVLDFNHDGWMDIAFTHPGAPGITLWQSNQGKSFNQVTVPKLNWTR